MSVGQIVFGVRIILDDYKSPVTEDTDIGLYNTGSDLAGNADASQKNIVVADATNYDINDSVWIRDDATPAGEVGVIASIDYDTETLTLFDNLTNAYTTAANATTTGPSKFRWIQNSVSGLAQTWNDDMLLPDGIGSVSRSVDLRRHGNVADSGGGTCRVVNTGKFYDDLKNQGIYFPGKLCQIVYFSGTTEYILNTYKCRTPSWNVATFSIPYNNDSENRNANITTQINVTGETEKITVPVTFGNWDSQVSSLVQTSITTTDITFELFVKRCIDDGGADPALMTFDSEHKDRKYFPVVGRAASPIGPSNYYTIQLGATDESYLVDSSLDYEPVGMYVYVNEDDGSANVGKYRRISRIVYAGVGKVDLVIENYFTTELTYNTDGTGAWVSIVESSRIYKLDNWPCGGFIDENNTTILTDNGKLNIFNYEQRSTVNVPDLDEPVQVDTKDISLVKLPEFGFEIDSLSTNNTVNLQPGMLNDSLDTILSFLILPVTDFERYEKSTLGKFKDYLGNSLASYEKNQSGIYRFSGSTWHPDVTITGSWGNVVDQDSSTSYKIQVYSNPDISAGNPAYIAFGFKFPELPDYINFSSAYIIIKVTTSPASTFEVLRSRFLDHADVPVSALMVNLGEDPVVNDLPDFYCTDVVDTKNGYFYVSNDAASPWNASQNLRSGYLLSSIDVNDDFLYKSGENLAVAFKFVSSTAGVFFVDMYEMAIAFDVKNTIKKTIYTTARGRTTYSTWGNRKAISNTLVKPIEVLEAICRWQNWSEYGAPPTGGWGQAYSQFAKIKLSGTGSFDNTELERNNCARQVLDYDDAYTYALKKSLCRDFWFINYIDNNGYECVTSIESELDTPAEKITLSDIVLSGGMIEITEQQDTDIFCEPFVRYKKNTASGQYESIIAFKNTSASIYSSAYVEDPSGALSGSEAETYWNRCHTLFLRAGASRKPPADVTDLDWANGTFANTIAKDYITRYIDWMLYRRVKLQVHFMCTAGGGGDPVRLWHEGKRFILQLPHETNNVEMECILEAIEIETEAPYLATIEAIKLDPADVPEEYYIKFVYHTKAEGADEDWVMDYTAKGDDNDKILEY